MGGGGGGGGWLRVILVLSLRLKLNNLTLKTKSCSSCYDKGKTSQLLVQRLSLEYDKIPKFFQAEHFRLQSCCRIPPCPVKTLKYDHHA